MLSGMLNFKVMCCSIEPAANCSLKSFWQQKACVCPMSSLLQKMLVCPHFLLRETKSGHIFLPYLTQIPIQPVQKAVLWVKMLTFGASSWCLFDRMLLPNHFPSVKWYERTTTFSSPADFFVIAGNTCVRIGFCSNIMISVSGRF